MPGNTVRWSDREEFSRAGGAGNGKPRCRADTLCRSVAEHGSHGSASWRYCFLRSVSPGVSSLALDKSGIYEFIVSRKLFG